MSLFKNIFDKDKNKEAVKKASFDWIVISDIKQLDSIIKRSYEVPVGIFKHSIRCGISNMVINIFEKNYNLEKNAMDLYYLDLLKNRDISNEISSRFNVFHQSPQFIVIKDGAVIMHESHYDINKIDFSKLL